MKNQLFYVIPKGLLYENSDDLMAYLLIFKQFCKTQYDEVLINNEILNFYSKKKNVYDLNNLSRYNYIKKINKSNYICTNSIMTSCEPFVTIREEEFEKFLISNRKNCFDLLMFFARIIDSFDFTIEYNGTSNFLGHMPQTFFMAKYNMSKNTVIRYFEALEEMDLIYIHRVSNGYNGTSNLYGRYEHKDLITSYANKNDYSSKANFHRSVSARYNRFVKNPESFTDEELIKLYSDLEQYNRDMEAMQLLQPGDDYLKKVKELDKIKQLIYNKTTNN